MLWLNWTKGSHTISVVRWVKGPNYGGVGIVSHWDQQPTCITLEIKVKNPLNKDLAGSGLMCMVFENNSGHNENRETDEWDYSHQDSSVSHTFSIKKGCTKSPLNTSVWFSEPCYTHCIILWGKSWIIWIINLASNYFYNLPFWLPSAEWTRDSHSCTVFKKNSAYNEKYITSCFPK